MKELRKTSIWQSPYWFLALLVVTVFAAEAGIMFLLQFRTLPLLYEIVVDGLLLVVAIFPALYFLVFRRFERYIFKITKAEALLRQDVEEIKKTKDEIKELNGSLREETILLGVANKALKEAQYASLNIMDDLDRERQRMAAALKERELLLREIHHRVKDNLQVMISLLRLQARAVRDEHSLGVLKDVQNRIAVMSLIHEKLYRSTDMAQIGFRDYIKDLTDGLFKAYGVSGGRILLKTDVVAIECSIEKAIPVGLIISELVTNSIKYAFPGDRTGEICVAIRTVSESGIELSVADNGVGIPKEMDIRNTNTLGMQLVTSLAEQQLKGSLEVNRESGTEFRITFNK